MALTLGFLLENMSFILSLLAAGFWFICSVFWVSDYAAILAPVKLPKAVALKRRCKPLMTATIVGETSTPKPQP